MICRLLARAQQGDEEAMLELINRFQPLLKKYAKKLRYDDAYEDCLLFFIELVKTMDLKKLNTMQDQSIAAYVKVSVTHFYSKKTRRIFEKEREIAFSDLTEEQRYYVETKNAKRDEQNIFTELGVDKFFAQAIKESAWGTSELARKAKPCLVSKRMDGKIPLP